MTNRQSGGAPDDELMAGIAKGDSQSFGELFHRHGGHLLGYAQRYLLSREKAEDITQDIWMKVIRLAPSYKQKGHFVAWIYTLTRNTCLNELRNGRRLTGLDSGADEIGELPSAQTLEDEILNKENWQQLKTSIDALPEAQRVALLLYAIEDLSYEDIASELDTTVAAVKSLIFRARTQIAKSASNAAVATPVRSGR